MAGAILERQLSSTGKRRVRFSVATQCDDSEIRRLLRENPMRGAISLSLEREPNYFTDAHLRSELKQTIVAHENNRLVCMGSCSIRRRFVNGRSQRVGYLGSLRLNHTHAGRFDLVRQGYEFFRGLQEEMPADFYFTSVASDNNQARRFLERGVPLMPQYEPLCEFSTILLSTSRQGQARSNGANRESCVEEFKTRLHECNRRYQFAPDWSASDWSELGTLGLTEQDFHIVRSKQQILTGAAIWDQRLFKQTVIRNYTRPLSLIRPIFNFGARLFRTPQLPSPGATLSNAFLTHLVTEDEPHEMIHLITDLRGIAAQRGIKLLSLGFATQDPRLSIIRKHFRFREYRSQLYIVRWPNIGGSAAAVDGRIVAPEAGLL